MNILYLTNHLNIGGISSYVLSLAKGLKNRGHQVYIASCGGELIGRFEKEGIIYVPIPIKTKAEISPKIFISLFKLIKYIKEKNIDVVHANTRVTQVLACLIQKYTRRPFVSTCHGFFKKRLLRKIFPCWGRRVIAISDQVKEHLLSDFHLEENKIRLIPNGVDIKKLEQGVFRDKRQAKINFGLADGPVVGIVARLSDVKGHTYLIEAMAQVIKDIPGAQLLIVGEGKMKKKLLALTIRLGIEKNVFFLPCVHDTGEVLSIMDLFVMPSLKEGLGLALMEAMSAGLAVIGSGVGGIRTLIQHGYNGLLVKPAESRGLACAILELLRDTGKREALGKAARDFINKNFSQEKMVFETEKVYLECLNAKY